jgi:hypothetical protein
MFLKGEVTIRQGIRTVKTRDAIYNQTSNEFSVQNGVDYQDPNLKIRGAGAHLDPIGGALRAPNSSCKRFRRGLCGSHQRHT